MVGARLGGEVPRGGRVGGPEGWTGIEIPFWERAFLRDAKRRHPKVGRLWRDFRRRCACLIAAGSPTIEALT